MQEFTFGDGRARVVVSDRQDGDRAFDRTAKSLGVDPARLFGVHQVHGARVVAVGEAEVRRQPTNSDKSEPIVGGTVPSGRGPSEPQAPHSAVSGKAISKGASVEADAIFVPFGSSLAACVLTADCVPVVLATRDRGLCVVHAGWPGLVKGVVESALEALGGGEGVAAFVGPHIRPCCYEFVGASALRVRARFGDDVFVGTSLDLDRALAQILSRYDVTEVTADPRCTGCSPELFSYRTERSAARLVTAALLGSVA